MGRGERNTLVLIYHDPLVYHLSEKSSCVVVKLQMYVVKALSVGMYVIMMFWNGTMVVDD